jgi:hypothetical protein
MAKVALEILSPFLVFVNKFMITKVHNMMALMLDFQHKLGL